MAAEPQNHQGKTSENSPPLPQPKDTQNTVIGLSRSDIIAILGVIAGASGWITVATDSVELAKNQLQIKMLQNEKQALKEEKERLNHDTNIIRETANSEKQQVVAAMQQSTYYQQQITLEKQQLATVKKQQQQSAEELHHKQHQLNQLQQKLNQQVKEIAGLKSEKAQVEAQLHTIKTQKTDFENALGKFAKYLDSSAYYQHPNDPEAASKLILCDSALQEILTLKTIVAQRNPGFFEWFTNNDYIFSFYVEVPNILQPQVLARIEDVKYLGSFNLQGGQPLKPRDVPGFEQYQQHFHASYAGNHIPTDVRAKVTYYGLNGERRTFTLYPDHSPNAKQEHVSCSPSGA